MSPRVFDSMPFAGSPTELLLLECRLTELYDAVDAFIIVESPRDHQDHPKPLNYRENVDRFAAWKDKITYVVWDEMPTLAEDDWTWAREHAQREGIGAGLYELDAQPEDIVFQSDLDEFFPPLIARNVKPHAYEKVSLRQRGHFWAIDWQYPDPPGWSGTVVTRFGTLCKAATRTEQPFTWMRESRIRNVKQIPNAGWHFSWLGRAEAARLKVASFCHPDVEKDISSDYERFWREGIHWGLGSGDFRRLIPVDVDKSWPQWMQDPANVPASWLRPR